MIRLRTAIALIVLSIILSSGATYLLTDTGVRGIVYGLPTSAEQRDTLRQIVERPGFKQLVEVLTLARREYVEPPDIDKMLQGATAGAVEALEDPYSMFFDAKAFSDFSADTSGTYGGIGVQVTELEDGSVVVMTPFPRTPGATTRFEGAKPDDPAGLRPGDRILEVDGESVKGMSVEQVASLIRGDVGTRVRLRVARGQSAEGQGQAEAQVKELEFVLRRQVIEVPTVSERMLDDDIGYLHILTFNANTFEHTKAALEQLEKEGMRRLVLDLRYNPGGLLEELVEVAGLFLPPGPVVHVDNRAGQRVTLNTSNENPWNMPLAVLVNEGTASASEILAGAVQDAERGVLVGTTTFGKGLVQRIWPLEQGAGVKLTVQRWFTPKGHSISKEVDPQTQEYISGGIRPHVMIELGDQDVFGDEKQDAQLQAAIREVKNR